MTTERHRLTDSEIVAGLEKLPGWSLADGKLHRDYQFRDFVEAWGFLTSAAIRVQEMDHHPEWFNVYNKVRIDLVTHSVGGVSALDLELAGKLEELAQRLAAR